MQIQLPIKVKFILDRLKAAGYEAYAVGGCVRDSLLGRQPKDWDITTSALPAQIKETFERTVDTGIVHGTVTVMVEHEGFEVTTYRIDGEYEDHRRPRQVAFTGSLLEDLRRRDFTINAMAYNEQQGLIDAFEGEKDLKDGIIRCVGKARERFLEDALRMLRAVRFSAQLGFSIEAGTREAILCLAQDLSLISAERIQAELVKLLVSGHPGEVRTLYELGISKIILPELDLMMETEQNNPHHCYTVGEHTIHALEHIPGEKALRLAMLLHDVAKPACRQVDEDGVCHFPGHPKEGAEMAHTILRKLKFDNDTIDRVTRLVLWHDDNPVITPANVRRAMNRIGERQFPDLFAVKRADAMAKCSSLQNEMLSYISAYEKEYRRILEKKECVTLKDLAVSGSDLIASGMKPGKEIGETLHDLLDLVLEHPEYNKKEILMEKLSDRA